MKVKTKDKLRKNKPLPSSKIAHVQEEKAFGFIPNPKKALLRNKTLIVGCGRLGASIANKANRDGKNVLVIDQNKTSFELLDDTFSGYTIVGDVLEYKTLEDAYITSAREIIITTGNDNINIFLAMLCRNIYDVPRIFVRLDDPEMSVLLEDKNIDIILPFKLSFDLLERIRKEEDK